MMRKKSQTAYETVWKDRVCPICGKRYLMTVREDQWGYASRDGMKSNCESRRTLFCSRPCMDEWARRCVEARVERMKKLQGYKIWHMYDQEYMTLQEIADKLDITVSGAASCLDEFENNYWRDIDYMLCHT